MKRLSILFAALASCLWICAPLAHGYQSGPFPDFDEDGVVGFADFLQFAGRFGAHRGDGKYDDRFDLDGDGVIGFSDFLVFATTFGKASPYAGDENDVHIPDANLRAVIADSLGKSRDAAITRTELATLIELKGHDASIRDLTGLQFAVNLTELWLDGNEITDLSALCDLTALTDLVLYSNKISDISALSNLVNLHHLNVAHNTVSDVSVLTDLTQLRYLDLSGNEASDVSALANLGGLVLLHLESNSISDISALSGMTNLTELNLSNNCISDLSALVKLVNLRRLNLYNNRISDFSPLAANTGLGQGHEIDVRKNPLSEASLNTHVPALRNKGVDVQFENQPVLACIPILPKGNSVDAGSSHTLQTNYLYVDRQAIRQGGRRGGVHAVAYADFSGDGHVDVFLSPLDGTPRATPAELYLNDGMGCFSFFASFPGGNPPGLVHPRKALPGDFNGDGRMDLMVLGHGYDKPPFPGEAPYVILSKGDGYVLGSGLETFVGFQHGGASGDVDADGDIDVFVTHLNATDGPFFLINDGTGAFALDEDRVAGLAHKALFTAELVDVDGDGFLDLLTAGHEYDPPQDLQTQILWGDVDGVYSTARATTLPGVIGRGIVVDIDVNDTDGDGDNDVVVNRTGDERTSTYQGYYLQLVEQVGKRRFEDRTAQLLSEHEDSSAEWFDWIRMCDCDADGDVDIVVDDASRDLIWVNDGTGKFRRR